MSRTRTRQHPRKQTPAAGRAPIPAQPDLQPADIKHKPIRGARPISLVKTTPTVVLDPAGYIDLRANAATATFHAGSLGIPAYFHTWTGMSSDQATCLMDPSDPHSVRLVYARHPNRLSATQTCRHGQWHAAPIDRLGDIDEFATSVATCEHHNPRAIRAQVLGDGLHKAASSTAETQQIPVVTLAAAHAADREIAKEHPES